MLSIGLPWDVEIAGVACPTHLVYGGADVSSPPAFGQWYQDQIPQAQLTVLEGEGHVGASEAGQAIVLPKLAEALQAGR